METEAQAAAASHEAVAEPARKRKKAVAQAHATAAATTHEQAAAAVDPVPSPARGTPNTVSPQQPHAESRPARGTSPMRVHVRLSPPPRGTLTHPVVSRLPEPHEVEAARLPRDVFDRLRLIMLTPGRWHDEGGFRVCSIPVGNIVTEASQAAFILDSIPRSYSCAMDKNGLLTIRYPVQRVVVTTSAE